MILFFISLLAGVLTVFAPCTISVLPIILGSSIDGGIDYKKALTVIGSLGLSIFIFTLLLKITTVFINIPQSVWTYFSGGLILLFGLTFIFQRVLDSFKFFSKLNLFGNRLMSSGYKKQNFFGNVLIGFALGPVFSSCSPTFFIIIATVFPQNFYNGLFYLITFVFGLCFTLFLVTILGQKIISSFSFGESAEKYTKRIIGFIFVTLGILIITGYDKVLELKISNNIFDVSKIDQKLIGGKLQDNSGQSNFLKYPTITNPSGFINTDGKAINLEDYRGKKVVLVDFWTYSCINCQRTIPYLKDLYAKYHDQGLEIVGVHTPEFAFEKNKNNVEDAVKGFGITWPIVMDNDYGTWNAFNNEYWPNKFLFDENGNLIYQHAGEGNYEETEKAVVVALEKLNKNKIQTFDTKKYEYQTQTNSPETYFGSNRNEYFGNGVYGKRGVDNFVLPKNVVLNNFYLGGKWSVMSEYILGQSGSQLVYRFDSKNLYFVAGSSKQSKVKVTLNGKSIPENLKGEDIYYENGYSYLNISTDRLYKVVSGQSRISGVIEFMIEEGDLEAYTFTFG